MLFFSSIFYIADEGNGKPIQTLARGNDTVWNQDQEIRTEAVYRPLFLSLFHIGLSSIAYRAHGVHVANDSITLSC